MEILLLVTVPHNCNRLRTAIPFVLWYPQTCTEAPKGSNIDTMSPPFLFALSEHEICVCNKAPHGNTGGLRYALQASHRNCQIAALQYRSTQGALSSHAAFGPCFITLLFSGLFNLSFCNYSSSSGACPSCAGHLHSVNSILVKMARKEEFSGLQA